MMPRHINDLLMALAREMARKTPLSESEARDALGVRPGRDDPGKPPDPGTTIPRPRQRAAQYNTLAG